MLLTMSQEAFNAKFNQGMLPVQPIAAVRCQRIRTSWSTWRRPRGGLRSPMWHRSSSNCMNSRLAGALTEEEFVQQKQKLLSSGNS